MLVAGIQPRIAVSLVKSCPFDRTIRVCEFVSRVVQLYQGPIVGCAFATSALKSLFVLPLGGFVKGCPKNVSRIYLGHMAVLFAFQGHLKSCGFQWRFRHHSHHSHRHWLCPEPMSTFLASSAEVSRKLRLIAHQVRVGFASWTRP